MVEIDWLTLVRPATGSHQRVPVRTEADGTDGEDGADGADACPAVMINGWNDISVGGRPGRHLWYSGYWLKEDRGSAFAGIGRTNGEDQEMILLTGALAEDWASRAASQGNWRATRIDLQVTVQESVDVPELIAAHRAAFRRIKSTDISGETLYIGSRTSERFWRIYNKAEQLRRPELDPLWRWELELKGKRAQLAWQMLSEENSPGVRYRLMYHNRIGIIKECFPVPPNVAERLPALPRSRDTETDFAHQTIIPFLRNRPHIRAIIRRAIDTMDQE